MISRVQAGKGALVGGIIALGAAGAGRTLNRIGTVAQAALASGGLALLAIGALTLRKKPPKEPARPFLDLITHPDGVNQYQKGGTAACTFYAARFLIETEGASPDQIAAVLSDEDYKGLQESADTALERPNVENHFPSLKPVPSGWIAEELAALVPTHQMDITFKLGDKALIIGGATAIPVGAFTTLGGRAYACGQLLSGVAGGDE